VVGKLFSELGPRYLDRAGGYTRIIRLSLRRLGDNGKLVLLQLLGKDESLKKKTKAATKRRSRRRKAKSQEVASVAESSQPTQTSAAEETAQSSQTDLAAAQAQEKPAAKSEPGKGGKSAKK
jgi:large subunit ribosomal protein L17